MNYLASLVVILCFEVSEVASILCKDSNGRYRYCKNGCCGIFTCCGSTPRTYAPPTTFHSIWSIGHIIPFVIGCLIGLGGLIGMIICCVKTVKAWSSGTTGGVNEQTQNQPNVVMMSTGLQSIFPIGQQPYPGQPQPYPRQPQPYPAQGYRNPAYPPTQPNLAYPPPFAGNPPPYGFNTEPYLVNPGNNSVQAASGSNTSLA